MYIKFESIILSRRAEKPYKILLCSKKKKKTSKNILLAVSLNKKKKKKRGSRSRFRYWIKI